MGSQSLNQNSEIQNTRRPKACSSVQANELIWREDPELPWGCLISLLITRGMSSHTFFWWNMNVLDYVVLPQTLLRVLHTVAAPYYLVKIWTILNSEKHLAAGVSGKVLWTYLSRPAFGSCPQSYSSCHWLGHLWRQMHLAKTQSPRRPAGNSALQTATQAMGATKQMC